MYELTLVALGLPLATAGASLAVRRPGPLKMLNMTGSLLTAGTLFALVAGVLQGGPFAAGWVYLDALSALLLLVVGLLSLTATLFSLSYMDREAAEGHVRPGTLRWYYALLQAFTFTMVAVLVVENLGLMWVGVEATTLATTLLVAFYFNRSALEAAWKYVMVCNVGILFALLGTILLYYAQTSAGGGGAALSRTALLAAGGQLDPFLVKLAFVFILIGYGTKAGLAPMHTWLPDAHSQAPSPVSGLLSGALLSCALYVLIRNFGVVQPVLGGGFMQAALLLFGLLSVAVAVPFMLVQHDVKRLLAYSSVEHIGIVTFGLGLGTPLAIYGAVFHILNHAVAKSALFYLCGIISQQYGTKHGSDAAGGDAGDRGHAAAECVFQQVRHCDGGLRRRAAALRRPAAAAFGGGVRRDDVLYDPHGVRAGAGTAPPDAAGDGGDGGGGAVAAVGGGNRPVSAALAGRAAGESGGHRGGRDMRWTRCTR